ncbi:MAG: hypothetical protein IPK19_06995 [Chloroflexi bacterium]|nr:hypothetical protein [Chloroflexota bacterium]
MMHSKHSQLRNTWFIVGLAVLLVVLTSVGGLRTVMAQDGPAPIVIAYDSDIDHIDPQHFRSLGAYDATGNLYEPLITQALMANDNGELIGQRSFEGAGAESYEVSEDGTVFTFHLRQDAKFADGTPITAHDYKYTLDRALNGTGYIALLAPFMALASSDQVVVVDDYTLTVTTEQPAALTETILAFQVLGAYSSATAEANATAEDPWADAWHFTNSNSSGPYAITTWEPGVQYVFEPNPNYWRGADWFQNSSVIFRVVPWVCRSAVWRAWKKTRTSRSTPFPRPASTSSA